MSYPNREFQKSEEITDVMYVPLRIQEYLIDQAINRLTNLQDVTLFIQQNNDNRAKLSGMPVQFQKQYHIIQLDKLVLQ